MDDSVQGVLSSTAVPLLPKPKPRRVRKTKSKPFKVTRFDKDVVRLIQSGTLLFSDICSVLGVDAGQARQRMLVLEEKGYLVRDRLLPDVFRVGIHGYNKFAAVLKRATPLLPASKKASDFLAKHESENSLDPVSLTSSENRSDLISLSSSPVLVSSASPVSSVKSEVDLAELLRQGAPVTPSKPVFTPSSSSSRSIPASASVSQAGEKQACALCRAAFKLSVKNLEGAKFAHCFCGAAYHKDCYHALVDGGTGCARCGRKLTPILDKHSEEALKTVKGAFD